MRDGDLRRAYMMLFRHSNLVLELLPSHPEFKLPESRKLYKPLKNRVTQALMLMEQLQPEIRREYEEWELMTRDQKKSQRPTSSGTASRPTTYEQHAARDPSLAGNAKILDAADHQDLAVDLAQKEFRKRDAARRATRQAGISEEEERERRKAGSWDSWDPRRPNGGLVPHEEADFRRQMEAARRQLAVDERHIDDTNRRIVGSDRQDSRPPSRPTTFNYSYPTIAKSRPIQYDVSPGADIREPPQTQPPKPPKEYPFYADERHRDSIPPPVPGKGPPAYRELPSPGPRMTSELPALPPKEELRPRELPVPSKPAQRLTFKPAAYLENGDPIRPVFLPSGLRAAFLKIAQENTRKGLEMCGMLCGTPVNNALFIKCLLIPEQKCTADTCETENESAMLDFCINEDLLVLGWIHTHPTQTCFMSSRDLHTQAAYQVMMPESIAIVCAPKFEPS